MALLVITYPETSKNDFEWIQDYRRRNNPRLFSVVQPHITLVFAIDDIEQKTFIEEVRKQTEKVKRIDFEIKVATINLDNSGTYYHEFFVPEKGYSDIIRLHDRLYSGMFSKYLRLDIDFIPHIGIGDNKDGMISKKRVDELNSRTISIPGVIKNLDIIEFTGGKVETLQKITLD